ncbi:MAG: glycosyltransferase family 2 protein [Paracoccus denitrificans]|uniref:Glycosyltransferase family 2 protein n=1 Tax=Paracoccus denitrificans TaxID=266 RepID=A0A533I549_PARDE|nr:MAG: glycosyltransferase family 2 protein [Paracoccus denitrificans]
MSPRHVLMSSMKDEGPFILEYVAHHRVLGFDAIHIASNDCSDGTDILLDALAAHGVITHQDNPLRPGDWPMRSAYEKIRKTHHTDEADWVMVLDVDEFLFVDTGAGKVSDLTALAGPEIDIISLSALSFGTSDSEQWQPGRVTEQFTLRLPENSAANAPIKSLSRGNGRWRAVHNHHPFGFRGEGDIQVMRGNGEVMTVPDDGKIWTHLRHMPKHLIAHGHAWYNHYAIKSIDAYMMRQWRGRGGRPLGEVNPQRWDEAYWARFAAANIADRRIIERYGVQVADEMARLLALPGVAEAQALAEERYGKLIETIVYGDDHSG